MGVIREQFEALWSGEIDTRTNHPFAPLFALEELGDRVAFVSSFANATVIDTDEGAVLVDTGSYLTSAQVHASVTSWAKHRVTEVVFTHGHIDHCFGVERYERAGPVRVTAHEAITARFERYRRTRGWNGCINARQFQGKVEFPAEFRAPDVTYRDTHVLEVSGERIELHHARGETDDATWVWMPSRKLLAVGDLFIWATPNAGNPQKVQRYPGDWARALRAMIPLGAELLAPGHGPPIWGAERVKRALDETATLLESLHDQTVAMMNEGATLDEILGAVRAPAHLLERPYLRPIYDEPEFIVRNVFRLYGGWWDGNPARLKPARDADLARELATLAGGANVLAARATALCTSGDLALAGHLAELAWQAAPDDDEVWAVRARVNDVRADREESMMARGIFRDAADRRPKR